MIRLILIRHGQTMANLQKHLQGQSDGALTSVGEEQAQRLAEHFQEIHIDHIISSNLQRAVHTAQAIANVRGLSVDIQPIVREWHCGLLDGLPAERLFETLAASNVSLPDFRPEGGETLREVQQRAGKFLHQVEELYNGMHVAVCSHGDFLRMLMSHLKKISIAQANQIYLQNASISTFDLIDGHWKTVAINQTIEPAVNA